MRTAEALAVWAQRNDPDFWPPVRATLEQGLFSAWKYFEHVWTVTPTGPTLAQMQDDKEAWASQLETAAEEAIAAADSALSLLFSTGGTTWRSSRSPSRTDVAEVESARPYVVTDVATGLSAGLENGRRALFRLSPPRCRRLPTRSFLRGRDPPFPPAVP
jgi:hypothetical protein